MHIFKKFGCYANECWYNTNNVEGKVNLVDKRENNDGTVLLMSYNQSDIVQAITLFLDMGASNHIRERK